MNPWLVTATVLILIMVPCGVACLRGDTMDRVVGLETAGLIDTLIMLVLAEGLHRPSFFELALALALLAFAGGLVFVRFLERWL